MEIAACIHNKNTAALLSQIFEIYSQKRGCHLTSRFFKNDIDLIAEFVGGGYDAVFLDGCPQKQMIEEIREKDGRVRLVHIAPVDSSTMESGEFWYCLPDFLSQAFVFPVLDRIFGDAAREHEAGILIKNRSRVMHMAFTHIRYVEVMGRRVFFHLDDGRIEEVRGTLSDFEEKLLGWPDFIKVHRAYIVNLRHVERIEANNIFLHGGHCVPGSKYLCPQIRKDWLCGLMDPSVSQGNAQSNNVCVVNEEKETYSILLVDDDEGDSKRFSQLFQEHGCAVCTAESAEGALGQIVHKRFDCVVLDVQLGKASGFDICQRLRDLTGAPVVYISVLTDNESQVKAFLTGGMDYITKDTMNDLIWLKIETRIKMAQVGRAELVFEGLRLDLKNRSATLQERELSLTAVEFDLLCLLMQKSGIVYSPARLYEMVWGAKRWDDGQTVQIHMSGLVRKLERICPDCVFVETIWGTGYRFVPMHERRDEHQK